jgi:toxin-antitoxin system PIN domain toxin
VGFAWTVCLAFLRLTTHPAVFDRPLDPSQAIDVVRGWLSRPAAQVVEPTSRHLDVLGSLLAEAGTAANLVSHAHLAAIAIEHDATLASFDADFHRFRGLRVERPGDQR